MHTIINYLREHLALLLGILLAFLLYHFIDKGAELAYGAMRLGIIIAVAFAAITLVFKSTLRPYIHGGDFADDFNRALTKPQRVWATLGMVAFILFIATECLTHAGEIPETGERKPESSDSAATLSGLRYPLSGFESLQAQRWASAQVRKEKAHYVWSIAAQIQRNRGRYEAVAEKTGVPWPVIACLHNMECSLSFKLGLYCGDPLTARTRNVPRGLPKTGAPPFAWEPTAVDALRFDRLDRANWATMPATLQAIESYNGTGYQRHHPDTPTPYLWSWTTVYRRGKYVADGRWDALAVSQQCGVAPILIALGASK